MPDLSTPRHERDDNRQVSTAAAHTLPNRLRQEARQSEIVRALQDQHVCGITKTTLDRTTAVLVQNAEGKTLGITSVEGWEQAKPVFARVFPGQTLKAWGWDGEVKGAPIVQWAVSANAVYDANEFRFEGAEPADKALAAARMFADMMDEQSHVMVYDVVRLVDGEEDYSTQVDLGAPVGPR